MKIGLLCDIHEDVQSLKQALRQLEKHNCNEIVCLGDIVGYDTTTHESGQTRNPSDCIAAIRSNCRYAVIGNHDLFALKKVPKSTHAFHFPADWYRLSVQERRQLSQDKVWLYETENPVIRLSRVDRKYLASLPEHLVIKCKNHHVYLSHSLHPDLTGSLMLHPHNPWELREHLQILKISDCTYGFSGHMHPNGIMIAKEHSIREVSFGRYQLEKGLAQYSCPGLADGRSRRGCTVVDFSEMSVETVKLSSTARRRSSWYGRILKKD